jgi:hypothetical protein
MRDFIWGIIFGAAVMYYYEFYGHQLSYAYQRLNSWRDYAVTETRKYK